MAQADKFGRQVQNYKGTRDYSGNEAKKRSFVINTIINVFESFGFEPLETPAIELDRILDGKYGEEGEKNRFKLSVNSTRPDAQAGLRYDHTVPLARFMAMNQGQKILPYRRYAIGKVWRYEAVQAGRLREFTQCDFDTVGSNSPIVDAEIVAIIYNVLKNLGFPNIYTIEYNDRRLLNVLTKLLGANDEQSIEILRAWDKLGKANLESTSNELISKGIPQSIVQNYRNFTNQLLKSSDPFEFLEKNIPTEDKWTLTQVQNLYLYIKSMGVPDEVIGFNPLLARGLDYYTGPIFETTIRSSGIGSIGGGGRFDNLVETLGGPSLAASGSSFGLERLVYVMDLLKIGIPSETTAPVFVTIFDQNNLELIQKSIEVASQIRLDGIPVEVYTGNQSKLGKQFEIANRKGSKVVIIIGESELKDGVITIKNLTTGIQQQMKPDKVLQYIRKLLS